MRLLFIFALFLFSVPAYAQSQLDMVKAAQADYFKADKKLNQIYKQVQKAYQNDAAFIADLKKAQLAWITLRDREVALRYPARPGMGSATPMCRFGYIQQLTEQRIAALQHWLDGVPEGDVCTGTMHMQR